MFTVPIEKLKGMIKEKAGLSDDDISSKIKAKMDELSGLVSEEGAAHIVANELGINVFEENQGTAKVENLSAGLRNVDIVGKVVRKYELRHFDTGQRSGKVANFLLGDETGSVRVVMWNDQAERRNDLEEGNIVKIGGAYVRENNGYKEVHLNDSSNLDINPEGVSVGEVQQGPKRKNISDLRENDQDVEVLATIVDVFDPRFFTVCPNCKKRAAESEGKFNCAEHGQVEPAYSYVMNLFIDDGTENMRAVLWKNQTEKLLGKSEDEMLHFKDNPADFSKIKTDLLGEMAKFVGRVNNNTMFNRLELNVQLVFTDLDPKEELKRLQS